MSGEEAVTDVIGSILLVGITVAVMVALSIMLVGFLQPDDQVRADLELAVHPGQDGWGTGDETVRIRHLGGEPVPQSGFRIVLVLNGTSTVFKGSTLDAGGGWDDGQLTTGETWSTVTHIPFRSLVELGVIDDQHGRLLNSAVFTALGQGAVTGGTAPTGPTAPTADFTAACTVLVCDFTDTSVDDGTIEAWSWDFDGTGTSTDQDPTHVFLAAGSYAVTLTVTDDEGLTDDVTRNVVAGGPLLTYVDCPMTANVGTVSDCNDARSASDADATADLVETAGGSPTAVTLSPSNVVGENSVTDEDEVFASDDVRAIMDNAGDWVEVDGFDVPAGATGIDSVSIGFEGRQEQPGQDPDVSLRYTIGGTAGATTLVQSLSNPGDQTFVEDVTSDRSWTVADVEAMVLRIEADDIGNRDAEIDHMFVTIVYTPAGSDLDVEAGFSSVPAGTHELQIRYTATTDTFDIQVWDGSAWNDRGDLTDTSLSTFTHALTAAEYNGGSPQMRFVDQDSAGGQATLEIEYARVSTS